MVDYIPGQCDIVWLTAGPREGHEQAGRRPAVVLSPSSYNARVGLALFCPVTSKEKGYPFEVKLPAACAVQGVVLADRIRSLDWRARGAEFICSVSGKVMEDIAAKVSLLLPKT